MFDIIVLLLIIEVVDAIKMSAIGSVYAWLFVIIHLYISKYPSFQL